MLPFFTFATVFTPSIFTCAAELGETTLLQRETLRPCTPPEDCIASTICCTCFHIYTLMWALNVNRTAGLTRKQSSQFSLIERESHTLRCNPKLSRRHEHFLRIGTFLVGNSITYVLMNSEFVPSLALINFGQCSNCSCMSHQ